MKRLITGPLKNFSWYQIISASDLLLAMTFLNSNNAIPPNADLNQSPTAGIYHPQEHPQSSA